MHYIAHRGNINGKIKGRENTPDYILEAISRGFEVEVDVFFKNGNYFLGHNKPQFKTNKKFLQNEMIWCHAKDIKTFYELLKDDTHCFLHTKGVSLTSKGYLWTYNQVLTPKSICCMPSNINKKEILSGAGVCSDEVGKICELNQ